MNKYQEHSKVGQKKHELWKLHSCEMKKSFDSKEAAFQKGQTTYCCKLCGKWHRSSVVPRRIVGRTLNAR